jgi:hypothetical protein
MTVTFVTVAIILSVVFIVLMVDARDRVRALEVEKLSVAEKVFTDIAALEVVLPLSTTTPEPALQELLGRQLV